MKSTSTRHAFLLTSALAAVALGFVAASGGDVRAMDETIVVYGCDPGMIELGSGENLTCIDPDDGDGGWGEDVPGGGGADDDVPGPYGGGGGSEAQEARRKQHCKDCKSSADKCLAQAQLAQSTCMSNARMMAASRCNPLLTGGNPGNTVTPWGLSIADIQMGASTGEPYWDGLDWGYECGKPKGGPYQCWGPAISNCIAAWQADHPNVTQTHTMGLEGSATFEGVGGTANQTITTTSTWDGRTGFGMACSTLGSNLSHSCTGKQNRCQTRYSCTAADFE